MIMWLLEVYTLDDSKVPEPHSHSHHHTRYSSYCHLYLCAYPTLHLIHGFKIKQQSRPCITGSMKVLLTLNFLTKHYIHSEFNLIIHISLCSLLLRHLLTHSRNHHSSLTTFPSPNLGKWANQPLFCSTFSSVFLYKVLYPIYDETGHLSSDMFTIWYHHLNLHLSLLLFKHSNQMSPCTASLHVHEEHPCIFCSTQLDRLQGSYLTFVAFHSHLYIRGLITPFIIWHAYNLYNLWVNEARIDFVPTIARKK